MTPTDPTPPNPTPAPAGLWRRTTRHRIGLLAAWLGITAALTAEAYLKIKPSYRASSLIRVDPSGTDLYNIRGHENLEPFLQTQVQLITSPNVLTTAATNPKAAVMDRIHNAGDVVLELRKSIQVNVLPGTYLIEVAMTSPLPREASTLVNAVVEAFMDANLEWSDGMTRNQIDNLTRYHADLKNQSDELERRWKDLVARGGGDGSGRPAVSGHRKMVEERLVENELARLDHLAQLESQRARGAKDPIRLEDLEGKIDAADRLDRALRGRLASIDRASTGEARATDQVDIVVIQEKRGFLKTMMDAVEKRLEQLKFESKGEARIRSVNVAFPPGRPIQDHRPMAMGLAPVVALFGAFGLFLGFEAFKGPGAQRSAASGPVEVEGIA